MATYNGTGSGDTINGSSNADVIHGVDGNDLLYGHAGNDSVFGDHGDDTISGDAGSDTLYGGTGSDSVLGGADNDSLDGGSGNDVLEGGDGNDTLFGGVASERTTDRVAFKWDDIPDPNGSGPIDDGDRITTGTQSVEGVNVSYSVTSNIGRFENENQNTAGIDAGSGSPNSNSALDIYNSGAVRVNFSEGVENVQFRINNFDAYNEHLVIRAYDAAGNQIAFNATLGSNVGGVDTDNVAGVDTFEGLGGEYDDIDPEGSMLVHIPGPVARIEMDFTSVNQWTLTFTDIYFDDPASVVDAEAGGDDSLVGGAGNDVLTGGDGNNTLEGGTGNDTLTGGAGDDVILLLDGDAHDTVTDFDLGDSDGDGFTNDQFDVSDLTDGNGNPVDAWDVVVTDDGGGNAVLTFPNGESVRLIGVSPAQMATAAQRHASGIPCFTSGARILTPGGEVPIDTLRPGDLVMTRDNGPRPIVWIGKRELDHDTLNTQPNLRPILIREETLGATRDMLVSPQHGLLLDQGGGNQSLIRAKHMLDLPDTRARIANGCRHVTYVHLMFERHQIIFGDGTASESFYPGAVGMNALHYASKIELLRLYPVLVDFISNPKGRNPYGATARPSMTRKSIRENAFSM